MDKIEKILSKGSSSALDFTLHDEAHSYRVAERMVDIIPKETFGSLSEFDLMMLLLSAYLHDIGMTPEVYKVNNHYQALTTSNKSLLKDEELSELQKWLDNESININIKENHVSDSNRALEIITYYSRYKHNDWSEEWIDNNLVHIELLAYPRWRPDLISICKSHHYGYDFLSQEKFDPRLVSGKICHRRYIAMCLRVADVLEIDPERTPSVILKHRNISGRSIPYWLKDQEIELSVSNGFINFYARPQKAFLHKAIDETIEQIEHEINLCNQLKIKKPIHVYNTLDLDNYKWELGLQSKDVKPFDDSYNYIKGSFRPNVTKVLELLGGEELYGNSLVAIRELLQNAFDAVKEKIAYKRLTGGLTDSVWQDKLGEEYLVSLSLIKDVEGTWLVCKDQGAGMTKDIIENYFLVSGASQKHQTSELIRKCFAANIEFERTGQFGIGVLSYFMIADKIVIKTKRSQDTGYHESDLMPWEFTIEGIQDFGELSDATIEGSGTEIKLLLKETILLGERNISQTIRHYCDQIIVKTPCRFEFSSNISEHNNYQLKLPVGWAKTKEVIANDFFKRKRGLDNPYEEEQRSQYHQSAFIKLVMSPYPEEDLSFYDDMQSRMSIKSVEGRLPKNMGSFRVLVPYFQLDNGYSFCYAQGTSKNSVFELNNFEHHHYVMEPRLGDNWGDNLDSISWKGFATKLVDHQPIIIKHHSLYYDIDLKSQSSIISVHRNSITVSDDDAKIISDHIADEIEKKMGELFESIEQGIWELYNRVFLKRFVDNHFAKGSFWFFKSSEELPTFQLKELPNYVGIIGKFDSTKRYRLQSDYLSISDLYGSPEHYNNCINYIMPESLEIGIINHIEGKKSVGVFFKNDHLPNQQPYRTTYKISCPIEWKNFIGASISPEKNKRFNFYNSNFFQIHFVDEGSYHDTLLLNRIDDERVGQQELEKELITNKELCQELIYKTIFDNNYFWEGLKLNHSELLRTIWFNVFGEMESVIYLDEDTLISITLNEWITYDSTTAIEIILPKVNTDNIIYEEERE